MRPHFEYLVFKTFSMIKKGQFGQGSKSLNIVPKILDILGVATLL
jgi:hypothetical protein